MNMFNITLAKQHVRTLVPFLLPGFILTLLVGPGILLAYPLQRWASRQTWDADDRWETIWCFAAFGLLSYLPLILWHAQFSHIWQQFAFLEPATFSSLRFRAFLMLFLVPTATLLLERISPRTNSTLIRVKHPGDVMQQQPAAPVSMEPVERKKKIAPKLKTPRFLSLTVHRSGAAAGSKRDLRLPGEVPYEEKQRRLEQAKATSPAPQLRLKRINWDEGEGTYSER